MANRTSQKSVSDYRNKTYTQVSFSTFPEFKTAIKQTAEKNHESVAHMINRLLQREIKTVLGIDMPIPENNDYMTKKDD